MISVSVPYDRTGVELFTHKSFMCIRFFINNIGIFDFKI
jgi:hypothetical protein